MSHTALTMIDLFCGCGGVTEGFKLNGFNVLAAVEYDRIAAKTYESNHPEVMLFVKDIRDVEPEDMMAQCQLHKHQLTVLSACAPCQPFSTLNQYKNKYPDPRSSLLLEVIRFVKTFCPAFVFIENVPGLQRNTQILQIFFEELRQQGYDIPVQTVVNAVNYGVPQFRKRLIIIATNQEKSFFVPEPTHVAPEMVAQTRKKAWQTVRDAFVGLEDLRSGEKSMTDPLHKARNHTALSLQRIRHVPHNGGSRIHLPDELQPERYKKSNVRFTDTYGRMWFDKPSNTLTTGCTSFLKGRYAHPVFDRSITLREAARLQTFPDTYQFCGNYEQISCQIGNAVPVKLAEVFARAICETLAQ